MNNPVAAEEERIFVNFLSHKKEETRRFFISADIFYLPFTVL